MVEPLPPQIVLLLLDCASNLDPSLLFESLTSSIVSKKDRLTIPMYELSSCESPETGRHKAAGHIKRHIRQNTKVEEDQDDLNLVVMITEKGLNCTCF